MFFSLIFIRNVILILCITIGVAMAYDIHISRGYLYDEENFSKISLEEWKKVISEHAELKPIEEFEMTNPKTGEKISGKTPNSALYKKKIGIFKNKEIEILLIWRDGILITRYTDMSNKKYWKEVAGWLNAQLYGEEGQSL